MRSMLQARHKYPGTLRPTKFTALSDQESGDRIQRDALRAIANHPYFHNRTKTIEVEHQAGRLVLTGRLPSFYLKQLLQEALRRVDGVEGIDNRVHVVSSNGLSSQYAS